MMAREPERTPSVSRIRVRTQRAERRRSTTPEPGSTVAGVLKLLETSGLDREAMIEVLGSALTQAAIAPYWTTSEEAPSAHAALATDDPELAGAVESLAPWLIGRTDQREAISAVEQLLGQ